MTFGTVILVLTELGVMIYSKELCVKEASAEDSLKYLDFHTVINLYHLSAKSDRLALESLA